MTESSEASSELGSDRTGATAGVDRDHLWALVLAGGDGKRLQDLTRRIAGVPLPKQYCRLLGQQSLLEATLARVEAFVPPMRTAVVVNQEHLGVATAQVRGLPAENVLIQPRNRDTGPGLLFSLLHLARRDPHATVVVFPSDHYIGHEAAFIDAVQRASRLVDDFPEEIVVLGMQPERPDPGLGYIMPGERLSAGVDQRAFRVRSFREKPTTEVAAMLLGQGGLWNSFVLVFVLAPMLDLIGSMFPAELARMEAVFMDPGASAATYETLAAWNFSAGLLERIPERLVVLPVEDVHWSDLGTPEAIFRTLVARDGAAPSARTAIAGAAEATTVGLLR